MKNYKYYYHGNTVYAVSSYAGKQVKAKATCAKEDEYNKETGEMLAKLRCEVKIAEKRRKKADKRIKEARQAMLQASEKLNRELNYRTNANLHYVEVISELKFFENYLKEGTNDEELF